MAQAHAFLQCFKLNNHIISDPLYPTVGTWYIHSENNDACPLKLPAASQNIHMIVRDAVEVCFPPSLRAQKLTEKYR